MAVTAFNSFSSVPKLSLSGVPLATFAETAAATVEEQEFDVAGLTTDMKAILVVLETTPDADVLLSGVARCKTAGKVAVTVANIKATAQTHKDVTVTLIVL